MKRFRDLFSKRQMAAGRAVLLLAPAVVWYACCLPRTLFRVPYSTVVTDRHGELLGARIAADGQWRFPERTTVPDKMESCLVAFEDKRFRYHPGIDPLALGRAAWQNLRSGRVVSGGSTLTMQTIRLARHRPRTVAEKIIEAVWATRLELRASKEEILALYLSHAPFGGNVAGVDAASWRYFGHTADNLSWAEAATLAVLPNAPSAIHPARRRTQLQAKRDSLLRKLYGQGLLSRSDYESALAEPLPDAPHPLPNLASHLVERFHRERNGRHTVSAIDAGLQRRVEELAERWSREFSRSGIGDMAVLVVDIPANEVRSYVGNVSPGRLREGSQVDIIQAPRSTGSILKPLLYRAMLREGLLLPDMLLPDVPLNVNGFAPQNFSRRYEGAVPASEALVRSLNIPAVILLQRYGVPKFHRLLRRSGFRHIDRPASHYGLSLILGGAEATLWEVTSAYRSMASDLLPGRSVSAEEAAASWLTLSALTEVSRPEEIDWKAIPSMQPVAWKTGTSYGFRDAWAVGVTARYAVGIWVGNATGEGRPGLIGAQTAGRVLFDVFGLLPAAPWFECPDDGWVEAEVCCRSGHLKGRFCPETETRLLPPAGMQTEPCPYHRLVTLSADGSCRLYEGTARTEPTRTESWFVLPPLWEEYYRQHHPEYRSLPPYRNGSGEDSFRPLQFIYPRSGAHIQLPRQLDGTPGSLIAEVACTRSGSTLYWHLDDTYQCLTRDFHRLSLQPPPGHHTLTVVDEAGNTLSVSFSVE